LWNDDPFEKIKNPFTGEANIKKILAEDVISPDRITVSFGLENYTVLQRDGEGIWYEPSESERLTIVNEFKAFSDGNVLVHNISRENFLSAMKARSIQAEFGYAMPFSEFCGEYGVAEQSGYESIRAFSGIGYSEASPDSVFICDDDSSLYYRLAAESGNTTGFKSLIAEIEKGNFPPYYPLGAYMGVENNVMIPMDIESSLVRLAYAPDVESGETRLISEGARTFFGDSFDFVRKITEANGTTVYMYGYGEKILIVNPDGSFEYKQEAGKKGNITWFDALKTALDFIAGHREAESDGSKKAEEEEIYLKDAGYDQKGDGKYRFSFGIRVNGHDVYYAEHEPFAVEITGEQVTYYRRDMINCYPADAESPVGRKTVSPLNVLASNYSYIYAGLRNEQMIDTIETGGNNSSGETMFEEIARWVTDVSSGYLRPAEAAGAETGNWLLPVWMVEAGEMCFYFDLYTAEPVQ
jgi:hypothetical protein